MNNNKRPIKLQTDESSPTRVSQEVVRKTLRRLFSETTMLDEDNISDEESLIDQGLDYILGNEFIQKINKEYTINLKGTLVFEKSTLNKLCKYLIENELKESNCFELESYNNVHGQFKTDNSKIFKNNTFGRKISPCIKEKIKEILADVLFVQASKIDEKEPFIDLGMDSILGVELIKKLNEEFQIDIKISALYEYSTVNKLSEYLYKIVNDAGNLYTKNVINLKQVSIKDDFSELCEDIQPGETAQDLNLEPESKRLLKLSMKTKVNDKKSSLSNVDQINVMKEKKRAIDIAIIGMSGQFAGANNLNEFWDNLANKVDSIIEVPNERWDMRQYYDPDPQAPNKSYSKWGGFLEDIDKFDPLFFNISPTEAEMMDPQQRLFLEESWKALEDAGYSDERLSGMKCGVFVGVGQGDYAQKLKSSGKNSNAYVLLGSTCSILSARISYFLNFTGPNMAIETACSSSLVALHQGCQSILNGESEMVLAGGVCILTTPDIHIMTSKAGMLSKEGKCKTFDNEADGFVPGEGVGVLVLKSLTKAIEDKDHIYGVIKGSGVNQDGKTNGITAPSGNSQTKLEMEVYEKCKINPEYITYVEAHGTGTKVGDPIEVNALTDAFRKYTNKKQYCAIGSVKTNIGHTLTAAGIASVIKVLLCLKHEKLVPSLNLNNENEYINFKDSPFYINTSLQEWKTEKNLPRKAAISSFGFSGTNCHMVIEEAPKKNLTEFFKQREADYIILLSAKNQKRLKSYVKEMVDFLNKNYTVNNTQSLILNDIAYTLQIGRRAMEERLAVIVSDIVELKERLIQYSQRKVDIENIYQSNVRINKANTKFIIEGDEGKEFVRNLLINKRLTQLAHLWVSGVEIDWKLLYPHQTPNRISLPTYPFAKERYWITGISKVQYSETKVLHPLIDKITPKLSLNQGLVFQKAFYNNDLIIRDHKVCGQYIFPCVGYLEMAYAALSKIKEGYSFNLIQLVLLHPLTVGEEKKEVHIAIKEVNEHLQYEIQSSTNNQSTTHAKGIVHFANIASEESNQSIAIGEIKARCTHKIDKEKLYTRFREVGIIYGSYFQGLNQIWVNDKEALGLLIIPSNYENELNHYTLHPTLMEGALQTIACLMTWVNQKIRQPMLPFAIENVEILHPLNARGYAYIKALGNNRFNAAILGESGLVCIKLQDIALKELREAGDYMPEEIGVDLQHQSVCYPEKIPSLIETVVYQIKPIGGDMSNMLQFQKAFIELEWFSRCLLLDAFQTMGVFLYGGEKYYKEQLREKLSIIPAYFRLYDVLLDILARAGFIQVRGLTIFGTGELETEIVQNMHKDPKERMQQVVKTFPEIEAYVHLLWVCLSHYPKILRGDVLATDIIFPHSSMELVERIYSGNVFADYYNHLVAKSIQSYILARLPLLGKDEKINIIEVGAGTGGTSAFVLEAIKEYREYVHYVYTDISVSFTQHGKERYGVYYPYVEFKVLDIEKDVQDQGYKRGDFDILLAANVMHATRRLRNTLRNVKVLLKTNGWLILNEVTKTFDFLTLFAGLLEGWWLYEDEENRLKGAPLLNASMWEALFKEEGFERVITLGQVNTKGMIFVQNVMIAESNGKVNMRRKQHSNTQQVVETKFALLTVNQTSNLQKSKILQCLATDGEEARYYIEEKILESIVIVLQLDQKELDRDTSFHDFGVDSIVGSNIINKINEKLNLQLKTTDLFTYPTIQKLTDHIVDKLSPNISETLQIENTTTITADEIFQYGQRFRDTKKENQDIAIIGISGRYPGAKNMEEFWQNLSEGKSTIIEIPKGRWDSDQYYDPDPQNLNKTNCKWGGILDDIDKFDPLFFNISGKEAALSDPQQRLFLEESWKALEDAGYANKSISNTKCGVFVGAGAGDYLTKISEAAIGKEAQAVWGNASSVLAARISYFLNLKGPCITIDTACSSSLVAIHLACQSILAGESDMALGGGVFVCTTPQFHILLSNVGMLSPTGKCKPFDNSADGFVPGEGVGVVVLKSLESALKDGDYIYGIIKGSGINQDGKTNGITAPSMLSQAELESFVYKKSHINPETISYVETHGLGTKLGDSIEMESLINAFRKYTTRRQYCAIGTVKPNIGHPSLAAGVTSVIKVLLALKHKKIPPTLNFREQNEYINFKESPFYVNSTLKEWETEDNAPRRAAINSFGFSGTNCHMVIEEALKRSSVGAHNLKNHYYIIPLSAKNEDRLRVYAKEIVIFFEKEKTNISLSDLAYTLQVGREAMAERLAVVVSGIKELSERLKQYCQGETDIDNLYRGNVMANEAKREFLIEGEEGEEFLRIIITNSKLVKLAQLWVLGVEIEWKLLYPINPPQRIPLPTYPFARSRYWVDTSLIEKEEITGYIIDDKYDKQIIVNELRKIFSNTLKVDSTYLEEDIPIDQFGVDSILLIKIINTINKKYLLNVKLSEVQQLSTIKELAEYIYTQSNSKKDSIKIYESKEEQSSHDIKINGTQLPYYDKFLENYHYAFSNCKEYRNFFIQSSQKINIEVITCGDGEPIIFLPPIFSLATAWIYQILAFSKEFKTIVFHYPGYGRSEYSSKYSNPNDIAESILEFIDILNIQKPYHLVGWSLGGFIAQAISLKEKQRIKTLTLVNTTSKLEEEDSPDNLLRLIELLVKDFESHVPESLQTKREGRMDFIKANYSNEATIHYMEQALRFDFRDRVSKIRVPTLIIAGGKDSLTPLRYLKFLNNKIKDSEYYVIKKGGHYIPSQNHKFFNQKLLHFLKKVG